MDVVAAIVPGAIKVEGTLRVTAPVLADAVISLAVPEMELTAIVAMLLQVIGLDPPPALVRR